MTPCPICGRYDHEYGECRSKDGEQRISGKRFRELVEKWARERERKERTNEVA